MSGPPAEARFVRETGVAAGIAALTEPVLEGLGYRLVLVRILQGQGTIVEIMAERPDGSMSIEDCKTVSLALSPVLDVHEPVSGSYRLQISSPGIDRPLVRPSDFDQWAGFEARVELKEMIDGRRRFRGVLEGFEDGEVRIEVDLGKERGVQLLGLPLALVDEAKLVLTDDLVRESLRRSKQALAALEAGEATIEDEAAGHVDDATAPETSGIARGRPAPGRPAKGGKGMRSGARAARPEQRRQRGRSRPGNADSQ